MEISVFILSSGYIRKLKLFIAFHCRDFYVLIWASLNEFSRCQKVQTEARLLRYYYYWKTGGATKHFSTVLFLLCKSQSKQFMCYHFFSPDYLNTKLSQVGAQS